MHKSTKYSSWSSGNNSSNNDNSDKFDVCTLHSVCVAIDELYTDRYGTVQQSANESKRVQANIRNTNVLCILYVSIDMHGIIRTDMHAYMERERQCNMPHRTIEFRTETYILYCSISFRLYYVCLKHLTTNTTVALWAKVNSVRFICPAVKVMAKSTNIKENTGVERERDRKLENIVIGHTHIHTFIYSLAA